MNVQNSQSAPLVAHVIFRLGVGGLENGLVNLINRMPRSRYRHAIICLKDATEFRARLIGNDVPVYPLHRKEGQDPSLYWRVGRLLRQLRPTLVHTRNLATIECQLPAWLAGVPCRVHGEHGWDVFDPAGEVRKYQLLRRAFSPLIQRFIPLSGQLESYLLHKVGVAPGKVNRICNGVDTERFRPAGETEPSLDGYPFQRGEHVVIGTVGRMHGVKDQLTLVRAFVRLVALNPDWRARARLALIGDGPLREKALALLADAQCTDLVWLPGERSDVPELMRALDIFVLPSLAEGISNTILEAMASALPVVATAVGGNVELVSEGETGYLVPSEAPDAMAGALARYFSEPALIDRHGTQGRVRVEADFSLSGMVSRYLAVYDDVMRIKGLRPCAES